MQRKREREKMPLPSLVCPGIVVVLSAFWETFVVSKEREREPFPFSLLLHLFPLILSTEEEKDREREEKIQSMEGSFYS